MNEQERALRNFEIYWARRPMNEMRVWMNLPPMSVEQFKQEVELEQGKVAEIAHQQRESWGDTERCG